MGNEEYSEHTQTVYHVESKKEYKYPISKTAWERLARMVKRMKDYQIYQILWSSLAGIFFTSLGTLFTSQSCSVKMFFGVITITSLVCGIVTFIYDRQQRSNPTITPEMVLEEMDVIIHSFRELPKD